MDADPWMQLAAYKQWMMSGDWYGRFVPNINAPFGDHLEWSRPFDLLLWCGHKILTPFLGNDRALNLWAFWMSPFFGGVTCYFFINLMKRLQVSRLYFIFCVLLFAGTVINLNVFVIGRADHHSVFMAWFVGFLLWAQSFFMAPKRQKSITGGLLMALGLWFSPETLPVLIAVNGYFCLAYMLKKECYSSFFKTFFVALCIAMMGIILLEHPPKDFFHPQHDRVSIVHLSLCISVLGGSLLASEKFLLKGRLIVLTCYYGASFVVLNYLFPEFYKGPLAGFSVFSDPYLKNYTSYLTGVGELHHTTPLHALAHLIILANVVHFGTKIIKTPYTLFMMLCAALFCVLYLCTWRYLYYYMPAFFIASVPFFQQFTSFLETDGYQAIQKFILKQKQIFIYFLNAAVVIFGWYTWINIPYFNEDPTTYLPSSDKKHHKELSFDHKNARDLKTCQTSCMVDYFKKTQKETLYNYIRREKFSFEKKPVTIMVPASFAPDVVYFTPHKSVGAFYTHNFGIVDTTEFFKAKSNDVLYDIVNRRAIRVVAFDLGDLDPESILNAWINGEIPEWAELYQSPPQGPYIYRVKTIA